MTTAAQPLTTAAATVAVVTAIQAEPLLAPLILPYVALVLFLVLHGGQRELFPFLQGRRL